MRLAVLFLGGSLLLSQAAMASPSEYFSYVEVLTQHGYHDSAGDADPQAVNAEELTKIIDIEGNPKTSEAYGDLVKMTGQIWDMRMLQAYVTLLNHLWDKEARDLAKRQIAWSAERKVRREEASDAWFDIQRAYDYTTRWQVGRLEESYKFPEGASSSTSVQNYDLMSAPKVYLPDELLFDLDIEAVLKLIQAHLDKSKDSSMAKLESEWNLIKNLWDGQLLVKYVALLRGLTIKEGLALGEEQYDWDEQRFALYEEYNASYGSDSDERNLRKYRDEYVKLTKERIAVLEERLRNLKPQEISEESVVWKDEEAEKAKEDDKPSP